MKMTNPKVIRHKSEFRTAPLGRSNPFLNSFRAKVFDQSLLKLRELFPHASEDWVRKGAWSAARTKRHLDLRPRRN
jgi:hypothetical protein